MKKYMLAAWLFVIGINILSAQTSLTIIGTQHIVTSHFNADSLLNMLLKIKPDIILQELDTDLMDNNGNYKGLEINDNGNERLASMKYKQFNAKVIFRRFDIQDRSFYYASHHTFAMEGQLDKSIDSVYKKNLLPNYDMQIMSAFFSANVALNILSDMDINTLNSKAFMKLAAFRQDWMYNKRLPVIEHTPALKRYYTFYKDDGEFWIRRNQAMIANITGYIKTFKRKRIVVLTGAMHKYFLTDQLQPLQASLHFKLLDLP